MRKYDEYLVTIDTIYPDGYQRESLFRSTGDMLAPAPMPVTRRGAAGLWQMLVNWSARRRSRLALRELDDTMLRDIGISRQQVREEVRRSLFL
ncbi:DUF1127 domain-containing protein [Agrobacterium sp. ES01]|uniref:DUF1127 domain-containing protein n=1 Tax=Agrobacterium sp. ES01 TaxID=3420714 RepID=UPI003D14F2F9